MVALVLADHLMQHQAQCALFPRDFSFPAVTDGDNSSTVNTTTTTTTTTTTATTDTTKAGDKGEKQISAMTFCMC